MKFKLKAGVEGAVEIAQGSLVARFEPGAVVEVENPNFAAHLLKDSRLELVQDPQPPASADAGADAANQTGAGEVTTIPPEGGTTNATQDPPPDVATQAAKPVASKPKAK